jgi:hypothetical protein
MRFAPRVSPENFRCAFTTGSGWGTLSQKVAKGARTVGVEARYGKVALRSLVAQGSGKKATVRLDGRAVEATCRVVEKGMVEVTLEEQVEVREGQRLTVTLR